MKLVDSVMRENYNHFHVLTFIEGKKYNLCFFTFKIYKWKHLKIIFDLLLTKVFISNLINSLIKFDKIFDIFLF
jgi:hypothetical protein